MRLQANGRDYAFPASPLVVLCLNGTDYRYIEAAVASGQAPFLAHLLTHCGCAEVNAVLPSLATPNNASIITGCPPSVHGICGNSFINPENGLVTPMDDPAFLRAETVLAAASRSGARVAAVSAKEKLRPMLAHGHDGICFSAETAASAWFEFRRSSGESQRVRAADFAGAPEPDVYSAELSLFALRAGAGLLQELRPDIMYLSTSDTIQHHYAPGSPEANMFFALLDPWLRRLDELGATLVITSDHGMSGKTDETGRLNCVFIGWLLDEFLGQGRAKVILPITDQYTRLHGGLGCCAGVHLPEDILNDEARCKELEWILASMPGVETVLPKRKACQMYDLPEDRTADFVVLAAQNTVLGDTPLRHDLGSLDWPLRSHGGHGASLVPMISNRKRNIPQSIRNNYDAFELGLNQLAL